MDADEELAHRLQEEEYQDLQQEQAAAFDDVHETNAPFKDLHGLFLAFNDLYFESKLSACEVKWSPRMTRCAGLCVYQPKAHFCSIRLSEPLLKFRSESDYIDTLLHEMIHAYLFITKAIQDHDGHGEDFLSHAKRINNAAGTNITVFHTFHDEVRHYQTHVWQCDGPCRTRPPYFGIVRRSMNRPPQPADRWWTEHQQSCGGTYTKISEPEPTAKKKKSKEVSGSSAPPPRPKTMLDDFVIKQPPPVQAKEPTKDSVQDPSRVSLDERGYRLSATADFTSPSSTLSTSQTPSPREAAALAAMARQERFLKERYGDGCVDAVSTDEKSPVPVGIPSPSMSISKPSSAVTSIHSGASNNRRSTAERKESQKRLPSPPIPVVIDLEADRPNQGTKTFIKRVRDGDERPAGVPSVVVDMVDLTLDSRSTKRARQNNSPIRPAGTLSSHVLLDGQEKEEEEQEDGVVKVTCPVCSGRVLEAEINDHIDLCIWRASGGKE